MPQTTPKFSRVPAQERRRDLIEATLRVVANRGVEAATVRTISQEAGVSFSLIRHHFTTKEDLLCAAFEHHMRSLTHLSTTPDLTQDLPPLQMLARFITSTLSPPVMSPDAAQIWAGFIQMVPRDHAMRQVHQNQYQAYHQELEMLIKPILIAAGRDADDNEIHHLALACNAVLDGLWLEGSMLPDLLDHPTLVMIATRSIHAILGLAHPQTHKDPAA
ncbi:TetR/AcrR family transcriptional regulator [Aestuariibius sp. HNIBRBA575]|uniref:TetR/AcrR family transcriptional regulator n=1 Tax=Aestuariibius sp. HNIBRBA575 TaxID=3233343 RepID=UPI0034A58EF4